MGKNILFVVSQAATSYNYLFYNFQFRSSRRPWILPQAPRLAVPAAGDGRSSVGSQEESDSWEEQRAALCETPESPAKEAEGAVTSQGVVQVCSEGKVSPGHR